MTTAALAPGDVHNAAPRVESDDDVVLWVLAEKNRILTINDPYEFAEQVRDLTPKLARVLKDDGIDLDVYKQRALACAVASTHLSDKADDLRKRHATLRDHALLHLLREFTIVSRDWDTAIEAADDDLAAGEITRDEHKALVAHATKVKNRRLAKVRHRDDCGRKELLPAALRSQAALLRLAPSDGQEAARISRRECVRGCPVRRAWNAYDRAIHAAARRLEDAHRQVAEAEAPLQAATEAADAHATEVEERLAAARAAGGDVEALERELLTAHAGRVAAEADLAYSDALKAPREMVADAEAEYGRRVALANEMLAADLFVVPYEPVDVWSHILKLKSASALSYIRSRAAGSPESWPKVEDAERVGAYQFHATRALWYAKERAEGIDAQVRNPSYRILTSAPINMTSAVVCEYTGMDDARFAQIRQVTR